MSDLELIVLSNANHVETVFDTLDESFKEVFHEVDIEMFCLYIHDDVDFVNLETIKFNVGKCESLQDVVDFLIREKEK